MISELTSALGEIGRLVAQVAWIGTAIHIAAVTLRRPLRKLPAAAQCWLWWLVAGRLLVQLAGAPAVDLAWLPAGPELEASALVETKRGEAAELTGPAVRGVALGGASRRPVLAESSSPRSLSPPSVGTLWTLVGGVWLLGAISALVVATRSLLTRRRLLAASEPVGDERVSRELARARRLTGVTTAVEIRRSRDVATPLVTGLVRPTIVLPHVAELAAEELRMVLLHELVHVRRRDAWRATVPALARRLLFFLPLARAAEAEFALATEAACDAEVVRLVGGRPDRYGALLVRYALGPPRAERMASSWTLADRVIHRRLDMLYRTVRRPRHFVLVVAAVALATLVLATPLRLVAAVAPAPPAPVAAPPPPASPSAPAQAQMPPAPRERAAPAAIAAPAAPAARAALRPPSPPAVPELNGADWLVLADEEYRLSLQAPVGAQRDAALLAEQEGRPVALVHRDGEVFVVRDAAAIDRLRSLFEDRLQEARELAEAVRSQARAAREQSREVVMESRRALEAARLQTRTESSELERLARREALRIAELEQRLEKLAQDERNETTAVSEAAREAAAALEALEHELERVREENERRRSEAMSERALAARRTTEQLAEQLAQLESERAELERAGERRARELGAELESLLDEIFERELADPIVP